MRQITAKEARIRFGRLLESVEEAPVSVTRYGRPVAVMVSVQQYERLRGAAWERLTVTMDALGSKASVRGLSDLELESLLADES